MSVRSKHQPCACGCGELADECMSGRSNPLAAFTITAPVGSLTWRCEAHGVVTSGDCPRCDSELIALTEELQEPCFYCRRGMHDSCISGEAPCRCCAGGA